MRILQRVLVVAAGILLASHCFSQTETPVLELVKKNSKQLRISPKNLEVLRVSNTYTDETTGITYAYLQQVHSDIKVHNSIITAAFKNGSLGHASGKFVDSVEAKGKKSDPSVTAQAALEKAIKELKLPAPNDVQVIEDKFSAEKKIIFSAAGIAKKNIEAELLWLPVNEGKELKLVWKVNIDVLTSSDWWNVFVDALNGEVVFRYNQTLHEKFENRRLPTDNQQTGLEQAGHFNSPFLPVTKTFNPLPPNVTSAAYNVIPFPFMSPQQSAPAQVVSPWLLAGSGNNAVTNGWHFDGINNYTTTRGNNVHAYLDITATNASNTTSNWPDTSTTAAPSLTFVNTPNFALATKIVANKKFAIDNLFYWNNLMHDVFYQYGFTEAAGNYQRDNLGRGGVGNDWVNAEAQDGGGLSNANFSISADGTNGRMQMFLWQKDTLVYVSSPSSIAKGYVALESATTLSTANRLRTVGPVTGQLIYYNDAGATHEACGATGSPTNNITGKIALIDRGTCNFTEKIKNAQNAGAIGVVMVNNVAGAPIIMGAAAADNTIVIPAVMVSQSDGATFASKLSEGVTLTLTDGLADGSLDNGIVTHEYGHGISSRLTGGPANPGCLSNAEQGGEGWSDYFSLMMTTNWQTAAVTDGAIPKEVGVFAAGGGIRFYPYTTNMSVNPLTYSNMGVAPIGTEVHNIGEIWCAVLWDMTWNIIQQQNAITGNLYNSSGNGGNVIALSLVTNGLKLQPCNPGFLDARDAILAADSILYNNAHKCAIWNAFARRGMGVSAVQGSSAIATDQVAAFDVPSGLKLNKPDIIVVNSGANVTVNASAVCNCQPLTGYVIRDTIPAGFTVVNSTPAGALNGNVYSFGATNFAAGETKTFNLTLQATAAGCVIDSVIKDNREAFTIGGFTSASTGTGGGWASSTVRANSGTSSWLATDPTTVSTSSLTSGAVAAAGTQNLSIFSFWHYFNTEAKYDGGVVEYSTNGGTTWADASPFFIKNGYTATMDATTILANRKAFTGSTSSFIKSILNLSSFGTTPVTLRFRMTTDDGTGGEGWYVDDIVRANGCGGLFKTGAYNASNVLADTATTPVFIQFAPNTITINSQPVNVTVCAGQNTSFIVAASSATALSYKWQLSTNGGTSFTDIAGQTSATLSLTGITAAMNGNQYRVVITDATSTLTSGTVTLTVNPLPAITTQPTDRTVCVGNTASFSVTASGVTGYQWQVSTDGGVSYSDVSGATSSSLSFTAALSQNNFKYRSVLSSPCGTLTSSIVTLTVLNAGITGQPASTTKCAGDNATFTVTTVGTVTYQWEVSINGGISFTPVTGATTATLTLNGVTTALNNNQYRAVVASSCGPINSTAATLTVNPQPAISGQPTDRLVCANTNASFTVTANGTAYQWEVSINGGTSYSAVSGATGATLSFTASLAQNNYKYRSIVTNSCGSITSSAVTLAVQDASITSQPANQTKCVGANADFSITASAAITGYQWQVSTNGGTSFTNIAGATSSTLSLTNLTAAQNNNQYRIVATAPCGSFTSNAATLTVSSTNISITALPARVCLTDAAVILTATPAGGVWSGTAVTGNSFSSAMAGIGTYTLTYTYTAPGNCVSIATTTARVEDCVNRNLTLFSGGIILYPNPNKGRFNLQVKSLLFTSVGVKIYNGIGQMIAQQQFSNVQYDQQLKLSINGAAGVYMVRVSASGTGGTEEKTFDILVTH